MVSLLTPVVLRKFSPQNSHVEGATGGGHIYGRRDSVDSIEYRSRLVDIASRFSRYGMEYRTEVTVNI